MNITPERLRVLLIIFIIISHLPSKANIDNSFIIGIWHGSDSVHVRYSDIKIDRWFDVDYLVFFRSNGSFEISTGNFLYDFALGTYRKTNNLDFDFYELELTDRENEFKLKMFNGNRDKQMDHTIEKLSANEVLLTVVLDNGKTKIISLKKDK